MTTPSLAGPEFRYYFELWAWHIYVPLLREELSCVGITLEQLQAPFQQDLRSTKQQDLRSTKQQVRK